MKEELNCILIERTSKKAIFTVNEGKRCAKRKGSMLLQVLG